MDRVSEGILNIVRREIARALGNRSYSRVGLICAYDPTTHSAKVLYQPEGTQSGWIPIGSHAVGEGFGVGFAPNMNDQVEVHFIDGFYETGIIGMRLYSTQATPPTINPGAFWMTDSTGSGIMFGNDGTGTIVTTGTLTATVGGDLDATISGTANITAPKVNLGGSGGNGVARVGDPVSGGTISAGSGTVFAVD